MNRDVEDIFQNPRRYGLTQCLLCPSLPAFTGVLVADAGFARRIGAAEGHMVFYALCSFCLELEDRDRHVTLAILAKHGQPAGGVQ